MRVERLELEDFRNYARETVALGGSLNLIVGHNAQGKTNLLEAVHCLSGLGSPRGPDAVLVRDGAERALLHATVARGPRTVTVDLELRAGRGRRMLVNKTPVQTRALSEVMVCVFFGPDELALVKGAPGNRRRFLDDLVVKLRPARHSLRRDWDRVLRQRNALLRSGPRSRAEGAMETLEVWNAAFCTSGAALVAARLETLAAVIPFARARYEEIAGRGELALDYETSWLDPDLVSASLAGASPDPEAIGAALAHKLEEVGARELERGTSLAGPQRDDISVRLEAELDAAMLDARVYASQGDQRTSALALKLGEHDLLADTLGHKPVLLLDDVFSELDPARRSWLAKAVQDGGQTLITATSLEDLELQGIDRVLEVAGGRVEAR